MQIEDSDGEQEEDAAMERDVIANQLFDGDDVSVIAIWRCVLWQSVTFVSHLCVFYAICETNWLFPLKKHENPFKYLNFHFLHASKNQKKNIK